MTYTGSCRRCGSTRFTQYVDASAAVTVVCSACGHPSEEAL